MPTKILICTNGTQGLGRLRRALRLSAFVQSELTDLSVLILTESSMLHGFRLPPRVDVVKLPSVLWEGGSAYSPKVLSLPLEEVLHLRERIILGTALAYRPDLLLVDHLASGIEGELLSTLKALKSEGRTTLVFGLRDVREEASLVNTRWYADKTMAVLEEFYDEIWVYGCQILYDPIQEYRFTEPVARKAKFCGYLGIEPPASSAGKTRRELGIAAETFGLVTVGSGRDGFLLLDTYLRALEALPRPQRHFSLVIGGPDLPRHDQERLRQRSRQMAIDHPERPVKFIDFSPDILEYMAAADVVVSMGGYNTLVEILALGKRALVVPRIHPGLEQLVRASLFERLGLLTMLHPDQLSPGRMSESILKALDAPSPSREDLQAKGVSLNGLQQVKSHVVRLLGARGRLPPSTSR